MKLKTSLLFITFTLFTFHLLAQPKLISEKTSYWNQDSTLWIDFELFEYIYENDLLSRKNQYYFSNLDNARQGLSNYELFTYNSQGLVESEHHFTSRFLPQDENTFWEEYAYHRKYDNNGCKNFEEVMQYDHPSLVEPYYIWRETFSNFEDCSVDEHIEYDYNNQTDEWEFDKKRDYHWSEDGDTLFYTRYNWNDIEWRESGSTGFEVYDEQGRLLEFRSFFDGFATTKDIYYYDPNGEYRTINKYQYGSINGFIRLNYDSSFYVFDDQNRLIEEHRRFENYQGNVGGFTFFDQYDKYTYYCDGLLKQYEYERFTPSYSHYKTFYEYDRLADCDKGSHVSEMLLYPNPASNLVEIHSELLAKTGAEVSVFSITGALVFHQKMDIRTEYFSIDVSNFPAGTYVVQVGNQFDRVSEKLMVW